MRVPPPCLLCTPSALPPPPTSLYRRFADRSLELFSEAGIVLQPYPVDEDLLKAQGSSGSGDRAQRVDLTVSAYGCEDRIRQARIVLIEGGSALQVLNFCIFPDPSYALPSFAADLVTLPGGHLIALDYAPHGDVADDPIFNPSGELADAFARHRPLLPDGGSIAEESSRFFSPYFLWSRLPLSEENEEIISSHVFEAFEDYLRIYLAHVSAAQLATKRRADSLDSQLSYSTYRAENDPARPMLTRLYGEGFAERLISEVLFDLPLRMEA